MPTAKKKAIARRTTAEKVERRRLKNTRINQQLLREKLAAGQHHVNIIKTLQQVTDLHDEAKKKKVMDKGEQAQFMVRLGALKTKLDAQFKLLNKYLPDLRSINFEDGEGGNPFEKMASAWAEAMREEPD